jgi:hypothetical protein
MVGETGDETAGLIALDIPLWNDRHYHVLFQTKGNMIVKLFVCVAYRWLLP